MKVGIRGGTAQSRYGLHGGHVAQSEEPSFEDVVVLAFPYFHPGPLQLVAVISGNTQGLVGLGLSLRRHRLFSFQSSSFSEKRLPHYLPQEWLVLHSHAAPQNPWPFEGCSCPGPHLCPLQITHTVPWPSPLSS